MFQTIFAVFSALLRHNIDTECNRRALCSPCDAMLRSLARTGTLRKLALVAGHAHWRGVPAEFFVSRFEASTMLNGSCDVLLF